MSRRRVLIGCGVGCGALLLLAIALAVGFGIWVTRPGTLLEPRRLVDEDTTGYLEWRLSLEDPGTEGFALDLVERLRDLPAETDEALPPWFHGWMPGRRRGEAEKAIRGMLPVVGAWALHGGPAAGDDLHLFVLSIERMGNRMVLGDWVLGFAFGRSGSSRVDRYRGERIYRVPLEHGNEAAFFLRGSDVFIATDLAAARAAVDRLLSTAGAAERSPTPLDELFARTTGSLRGALVNTHGELARVLGALGVLRSVAGDEALAELRGLTLGGGLREDGSLAGVLELLGPDPAWAAAEAARLTGTLREAFAEDGLPVELSGAAAGGAIRVEFRVPDVLGWFGRPVDAAVSIETDDGLVRIEP